VIDVKAEGGGRVLQVFMSGERDEALGVLMENG
jgi:hypothetical protein